MLCGMIVDLKAYLKPRITILLKTEERIKMRGSNLDMLTRYCTWILGLILRTFGTPLVETGWSNLRSTSLTTLVLSLTLVATC